MGPVSLSQIDEFLKQKRIAIIGLSRNPKDYTRSVYSLLKGENHEIIPVNPNAEEIEGEKCFKSITAVDPAPDAAMIFTEKAPLEDLVEECINAGIGHIWIHNLSREKGQKDRIYETCKKANKNIIIDFCPIMFLPESGFFHKFHGFCLKITGNYPKKQKEAV